MWAIGGGSGIVGGLLCAMVYYYTLTSYAGLSSRECSTVGPSFFPAGRGSTRTLIIKNICTPFHDTRCDNMFDATRDFRIVNSVSASVTIYY